MFWSEHTGKEAEVYQFKWTPKTFKLKEEGTYCVGLDMPDDDLHKYQENLTFFLNRWERRFNLPAYSVVSKAEKGQLIVEINYGGQAVAIEGINIVDIGGSVRNAAGDIFDRSVKEGKFEVWVKRP